MSLEGEIDLIWLNTVKPQFAQKPEEEIKRKRKVEEGVAIYYSYKDQEKNCSMLHKLTNLDQMLPSWLKNMVYKRNLELNSKM